MEISSESWLVGARGLHHGTPSGSWSRLGVRTYPVHSLCRSADALYVGTAGGLWDIRGEDWIQRHDETLTEVLAVCRVPGSPGVATGSPYGVAVVSPSPRGPWRWAFCDEGLSPNERFTSCLLAHPGDPQLLLAGTEAGTLIVDMQRHRCHPSGLLGTPVRALLRAQGFLWAGTDSRGVWRSVDGEHWAPVGHGLEADAVFSLAAADGGAILAGTSRGIAVGDGGLGWRLCGPRILVSALAVAGEAWLAGASPGGLWFSEDRGLSWAQIKGHAYVRALAAPPAKKDRV